MLRLQLQKKEVGKNNLAFGKYALLINNSADIICIIIPGLEIRGSELRR